MYLCTGSNTTKAANRRPLPDPSLSNLEQLNWVYTSGTCMDCLHPFEFVEDPSPKSNRFVLPAHFEDGTLLERVVKEALVAPITAEIAARHFAQIRTALKEGWAS
jgi:hypothetical protein